MKLFAMETDEWREERFTRGSTWRSSAAYRCVVCHTMTNKWEMGGWPGRGPRITCPGEFTLSDLHLSLEQILHEIAKIRDEMEMYKQVPRIVSKDITEFVTKHTCDLKMKIQAFEMIVDEVRKQFPTNLYDIQGLQPGHDVLEIFPSSRSSGFLENKDSDRRC